MDQSQQQPQRELVYCHQCENEWYRDEHGIICPDCQSEFTQIIEANNDPRQEEGPPPLGGHHGFFAPDPDEGDIDEFRWHYNRLGEPAGGRPTGTFTRDINIGSNEPQGGVGVGAGAGGLFSLLGPALQGILGGQRQRTQGEIYREQEGEGDRDAPGLPHGHYEQHQGGNGGTFVRHGAGPGYSFTITTSSNSNLFPRDANGPQPFQNQPDNLHRMMAQMFANIGAMPGHGFGEGRGMHGGHMFVDIGGGPHGGGPGMHPFANLFQMLGVPPGGVHGDAVYSQEGLDQIISQLMEQHRSGNAPPPASADAIESLPRRPISQKDLGDNDKADCSICMDEAELGSLVTELPCGHWFHHDCIKAWLGEHDTCPHCRQGITPKDGVTNDGRARQPSQPALHDIHRDHYSGNVERSEDTGRQGGESSGGLFGRLRQTFSPGAAGQRNQPNRNQQGGSSEGNASGR